MSQIDHIDAVEAKLRARTDRIRSLEQARLALIEAERQYITLAQACLLEDLNRFEPALLDFPDGYGGYYSRSIDSIHDIDSMVVDAKDYSVRVSARPRAHRVLKWGGDG